jgi:hypothetical protein
VKRIPSAFPFIRLFLCLSAADLRIFKNPWNHFTFSGGEVQLYLFRQEDGNHRKLLYSCLPTTALSPGHKKGHRQSEGGRRKNSLTAHTQQGIF